MPYRDREVIAQILSYAFQGDDGFDAVTREMFRVADARQHQKLR